MMARGGQARPTRVGLGLGAAVAMLLFAPPALALEGTLPGSAIARFLALAAGAASGAAGLLWLGVRRRAGERAAPPGPLPARHSAPAAGPARSSRLAR